MGTAAEAKIAALRRLGYVYLHADRVIDPLFRTHEFFDANDLVQVRYEMLRRVRVGRWSVTTAAAAFGFSRPAFYQAQTSYQRLGLPGLIHRCPGPRHSHKLTDAVRHFLTQQRGSDPLLRSADLADRVRDQFGLIHPRTIERAQARRPKKVQLRSRRLPTNSRSAATKRGRSVTKTCAARCWNAPTTKSLSAKATRSSSIRD